MVVLFYWCVIFFQDWRWKRSSLRVTTNNNIFVSFKEHHDCDDNIRRGWEQFEAVPDFTSFQTKVLLLQYWINIAGRRRVNNIIFFIMSVAVLLTLFSSLSLLLTVLPLALLLACLAFLCWQSENDIVRKFDLDKHLMRFLRMLDRYFCWNVLHRLYRTWYQTPIIDLLFIFILCGFPVIYLPNIMMCVSPNKLKLLNIGEFYGMAFSGIFHVFTWRAIITSHLMIN